MEGTVRAILQRHAGGAFESARAGPASASASEHDAIDAADHLIADPNALVPAAPLASHLATLSAAEQRRIGSDYADLWSRTFRTLVSHLRGRPERAVSLFAEEVYPFLRGDRRAARVERTGGHEIRLALAADLPAPYLCGMLEGFVRLSGASGEAVASGTGLFDIRYRVSPSDRLARALENLSTLRLGLVASALLAATVGVAMASRVADIAAGRAALVLGAVALAQLGANALHDLRHAHPAGPLALFVVGHRVLALQAAACLAFAAAAALWLGMTGNPTVLVFAVAGLMATVVYAPLRNHGFGPVVILMLYGPLIAAGALHAFDNDGHLEHVRLLVLSLVPGAFAAAALYVDDLATAPLDEAGGKRTLAVRLPRQRQVSAFVALLAAGLFPFLVVWRELDAWTLAALVPLAIVAVLLARRVQTALDDPHSLAPARLGTQLVHVAASALVVATVLAGRVPA